MTNAFKRENSAPEIGYSIVFVFSLQNKCKIGGFFVLFCVFFGRRRTDKVNELFLSTTVLQISILKQKS